MHLIFIWLSLIITSCSRPHTQEYHDFYAHLIAPQVKCEPPLSSDHYLLIFVDAPHLDYTNNSSFLRTLAKHPSTGSKQRDFGHAWIRLHGKLNEDFIDIEGGHSGELGIVQPKYFDGIMNYLDYGCLLRPESCNDCQYEPNPIKYLWHPQNDGFFQRGSGGHKATYGVQVILNEEQFKSIYRFIRAYNYSYYSLTEQQCSSFVYQIAHLAGIELASEVSIPIEANLCWEGKRIRLWTDPSYSLLTLASPDVLEKSLMEAVDQGLCRRIKPFN